MVPGHTVSISSSYNHVVHPQVVVRYSQKSTDSPQDRLTIPQAHPQICPEQQEGAGEMHCPYCRNSDSKVLDSRTTDDGGSIRRRRQCPSCERRFTTIEQMQLVVVKRSGVVEPFNRDKVINGVRKACKGRPVSEDQLARLGQLVEDSLRTLGQPEIPADEVGVAILGPLRELDQVAYLRFASVYRQFRSVEDFEAEIALLRIEQEPTGIEPLIPDRAADNKMSTFVPHRLTPARERPEPP